MVWLDTNKLEINNQFPNLFDREGIVYRVGHLKSEKILYRNAQPIMRLHGRVICHMNGNFVSFQIL